MNFMNTLKNSKIEKMQKFLDWMKFKVKTIHVISNKEFVNILDKM